MTKYIAYMAAIVVAAFNIWLHHCARNADGALKDRIFSMIFAKAFLIGSASLFGIFVFYKYANEDMARGIILMGSISIIGGTMFAIACKQSEITAKDQLDWLLVSLLAIVLLTRLWFTFSKPK